MILRGFRDEDILEKFREVCKFLGVGEIGLTELRKIEGSQIIRVKINCREQSDFFR